MRTSKMFITITTSPKMYKYESLIQAERMIPLIIKLLKKLQFEGDMYCEGTKAGNIHFHGLGTYLYPHKIKYANMWLTNYIKRNSFNPLRCKEEPNYFNIGYIDVENCSNEEKALLYISKDRDKSIELFKRHHIWEQNYPIDPTIDYLGLDGLEPAEIQEVMHDIVHQA